MAERLSATPTRRGFLRTGTAAALVAACGRRAGAQASDRTVVDVAGRTVTLPAAPRRILLAQGRQFPALTLLHPDPADLLVGIGGDFARDAANFGVYSARYPRLAQLPVIGRGSPESFSVERALALAPDLVLTSSWLGGESAASVEQMRQFEAAGIPVLVVDFFAHPLRHTPLSMRLLGEVLGRRQQAEAFVALWQGRLDRVTAAAAAAPARPSVFMHVHAGGGTCCYSPGKGTFDGFITAAGGHNIGADVLPGSTGELSVEYVLSRNPDVYIATGGAHLAARSGFVLGPGVDAAAARASLRKVVDGLPLAGLGAVQGQRAYGLWHPFNDTPLNIVAVEAMARWLHPHAASAIDPAATLAEINERFAQVPLGGTLWTGPV